MPAIMDEHHRDPTDAEIDAALGRTREALEQARRDGYWGAISLTFPHRDGRLTGEVRIDKQETRKLFPPS